jgi:hypothetical protein
MKNAHMLKQSFDAESLYGQVLNANHINDMADHGWCLCWGQQRRRRQWHMPWP